MLRVAARRNPHMRAGMAGYAPPFSARAKDGAGRAAVTRPTPIPKEK